MAVRGGLPWYQIWTEFSRHPKTREICARVGDPNAGMHLVRLFEHAADHALDGRLLAVAVEYIAEWRGKRGELLAALEGAQVLEVDGEFRVLHGWVERNGARIRKALADAAKPRGNKKGKQTGPPEVPSDYPEDSPAIHPPSRAGPPKVPMPSLGGPPVVPPRSPESPAVVDLRSKTVEEEAIERASELTRSLGPASVPRGTTEGRNRTTSVDDSPRRRPPLLADLTEIPDEEAALAKAELEAELRAGYGTAYERTLLIASEKLRDDTVRDWIERVRAVGRATVVADCLEQAASYWRQTAGHVESLRFFLTGLQRLRAPRPPAEEGATCGA
jgi:hypothetical protein